MEILQIDAQKLKKWKLKILKHFTRKYTSILTQRDHLEIKIKGIA